MKFQSYDICNPISAYVKRGSLTWRFDCLLNTIAKLSISCIPGITRARVWTHGILAYRIDVTGMGTSGTFIQV